MSMSMNQQASALKNSEREPHAVARLRAARLAVSTRPFRARGGPKGERCAGCRLRPSHCTCDSEVRQPGTRAGICLLMHDAEPIKPSNTGWLIADVVPDTFAFGWSRIDADAGLLELLRDPRWQPFVVFPAEYVTEPRRVVHDVQAGMDSFAACAAPHDRRPLFILLDGTWSQARKMYHKCPYLDGFPVLSLQPDQVSAYRLRRSHRGDHFCTSEVAALCLELSGDEGASRVLSAWLDVFSHHYEQARNQRPPLRDGVEHQQLRELLAR
ncbi:tRNA-uridine aminocarboxypropyltransferase [Diaphorobacter aerolatus]|uniref:tRNA-uridine aminocarboxypropyltransferase n=1 Tax=Diaphorobacter aerolatus TaxID=1288495 RepID=A0A7H0GGV9_9BURK|nr:tRNA-uridine aminocarboxypropyltransferase [Diaphorobacter aerolatus]QNP47525.1 DTW domain-containing protein [Diaphorobacter aerolatus]